LRLWAGYADEHPPSGGGAVINDGHLRVVGCSIDSNYAVGSGWPYSSPVVYGGAILSTGSLTIQQSDIAYNGAGNGTGLGGAVYSTGPLVIEDSNFVWNIARTRGSAVHSADSSVVVRRSSFHGNYSLSFGGYGNASAVEVTHALPASHARVVIVNTTMSGNLNCSIRATNTPVVLANVTISDYSGTQAEAVCVDGRFPEFWTGIDHVTASNSIMDWVGGSSWLPELTIRSNGRNIIRGLRRATVVGAYEQVDPRLATLKDNGGSGGFTRFPLAGSPAINAGDPAGCIDPFNSLLVTDQRGVKRPIGARCDLGAVEADPNGDANADGVVDALDVFVLVSFLFANGTLADGRADVDGDGVVGVADLFYLVSYLFAGGPAPA
jgi:hypothetical protein